MELEGIVLIFLSVQETTIPKRGQSVLCYYVILPRTMANLESG